jgi:hypothetical protein
MDKTGFERFGEECSLEAYFMRLENNYGNIDEGEITQCTINLILFNYYTRLLVQNLINGLHVSRDITYN